MHVYRKLDSVIWNNKIIVVILQKNKNMESRSTKYVYSQEVIDMLTVAVQICLVLEHLENAEKTGFIDKMLKLLPMLFLKTEMLEADEHEIEGYLQTFVSEEEYNIVAADVANLMGNDDAYLDVFIEGMRYSDTPVTSFISENLADIYQELKDLAGNFQSGNENVMEDALHEVIESFHSNWGQKLLNTLRALFIIKNNFNNNLLPD